MNPDRTKTIRRRVKLLTWLFIAGLVLSGATAIPLESEVNGLVRFTGAAQSWTPPENVPTTIPYIRLQATATRTIAPINWPRPGWRNW